MFYFLEDPIRRDATVFCNADIDDDDILKASLH